MFGTPTHIRDAEVVEMWLVCKGFTKNQINHIKDTYEKEDLQYCIKSLKTFNINEMKGYFKSNEYKKIVEKKKIIENDTFIYELFCSCEHLGLDVEKASKNMNLVLN